MSLFLLRDQVPARAGWRIKMVMGKKRYPAVMCSQITPVNAE
jgi:hypothetical protein